MGEEFIVGSINEEYYRFFKNSPISFQDYIDETLNDILLNEIPNHIKEMYDLDYSSRFEQDDIVHAYGAYHDDDTIIEVTNELGEKVYEASVIRYSEQLDLEDVEHESELEERVDIVNCDSRYVLIGMEWSKGLHDEFELSLDSEVFDPSKLKILYKDYDECSELISGIMYNGVKLESNGELGTTGKGAKWCIRDNKTLEEI